MSGSVSIAEALALKPSQWSSFCGGAPSVTRIACVGDSLTAGDNFHSFDLSQVFRCRMSDANCRGNFPLSLQELLGPAYQVTNHGIAGYAACGNLPPECLEPSPPAPPPSVEANNQTTSPRLPLSVTATSAELSDCTKALLRTDRKERSLLGRPIQLQPHVVVFMLGTNDAAGFSWDKCGAEGTRRAILLYIYALWKMLSPPPMIFLLTPPPVLGEFMPGKGCIASHMCRYHPSKSCWMLRECANCGSDDKVDNPYCIRVPELRKTRDIVEGIGSALRGAMSKGGGHGKCSTSPVHVLQMHRAVPANSLLFAGPVHLQAKASALVACELHGAFSNTCGSNQCAGVGGKHHDQQLGEAEQTVVYNSTAAAERHTAFCGQLRTRLESILRPPDDPQWDVLQQYLHPLRPRNRSKHG